MILESVIILMALTVLAFGAYLRIMKDPGVLAGYDEGKVMDPVRLCIKTGNALLAMGIVGMAAAAFAWLVGEGLAVLLVYMVMIVVGSTMITRVARGS